MSQPYLHHQSIVLQAPIQCWSAPNGQIELPGDPQVTQAQGIFCGDDRVISRLEVEVVDRVLDHLVTHEFGGPRAVYQHVVRTPELGIDPQVILERDRVLTGTSCTETLTFRSAATHELTFTVRARITPDATALAEIKSGLAPNPIAATPVVDGVDQVSWHWRDADTTITLSAPNANLTSTDSDYVAEWSIAVPSRGQASISWSFQMHDAGAPFVATTAPALVAPQLTDADPRLQQLLTFAFADLNGLRLAEPARPTDSFFAAGAPWFFTLFGRDSIISARLLLPYSTEVAASTLRVLAARQGTTIDTDSAEQPGKILHEVRRVALNLHDTHQSDTHQLDGDGGDHDLSLPPEYYGTIDATPLWILLLSDAAKAGLNPAEVRDLLPALRSTLVWLRDHADADGDGFLEYFDESGHGLANQGWKDSGDSIRWANGERAAGPIALAEVQGYAHAAALAAADLLEQFGTESSDAAEATSWREWAASMQARFREKFWASDELGAFPVLALDRDKRAVDGVSSNIGHLLGTGIVNHDEAALIVRRLMDPSMASGYGIRTLSTTNAGYWPLGYHVGSVWTHDTAMIIDGMLREGFATDAAELASQLLRAAEGFGYRMPELYGGEAASIMYPPQPYPAACRPQAWAAASAVAVARALHPEWMTS